MRLQGISRSWFILLAAVVAGLMVACTCVPPTPIAQVSKPTVVIIAPADGSELPVGQAVDVQVVATDSQGVRRVELSVGGGLVDAFSSPSPQSSLSATMRWIPNTTGVHTLMVVAYNVNDAASDPAIVRVNVGGGGPGGTVPVVVSFSASPPAITVGDSSTLQWEVTNATDVVIDQGVGSVALSGSQSVSPASTTTYVLTARGDGGEATATATVTVNPGGGPPGTTPVITVFVADPPTIDAGDSSTLRWEVTDATSVEIDQGIGGVALSGSRSVNPASTTTYQLTAHGTGGDATATAQVTVNPAPPAAPVVQSFTANPATINAGESSTLQWAVTGATSVEINHGIGGVALSGSQSVNPASTTTYQLTAHGPGGDATATTQVTVNPTSGGTINATITPHSYNSSTGWVTFRIVNSASGARLESVRTIIVNRDTNATYFSGVSNTPFHPSATSSAVEGSLAPGATKYLRYKLTGNPTGVPCRATFALYTAANEGGTSAPRNVEFTLAGGGTINADITPHSYNSSTGLVTFRVQNTGSLVIESVRLQVVNRDTSANYYGPATKNTSFFTTATGSAGDNNCPVGGTRYIRCLLSGKPTGVPCRATITLYSQDNGGGSSVAKTVDFSLAGGGGTINADITPHSYNSSTGLMTFRVQNTGSLVIESVRLQVVNRDTSANYYGPAIKNVSFFTTATGSASGNSCPVGGTRYIRCQLSGNPTGVPCRATITLYSQDNAGGASVTKTVNFTLT